jgi:hypothetical protein
MDEIATQALENGAKVEIASDGRVVSQQRDSMKIRGQRPDLGYFFRRANQEIFVFAIQPAQRSHDVASVSANAKLRHPPDVDGDSHGRI